MSTITHIDPSVQLLAGQRVVKIGNYFFPVGVGGNFMPGTGETVITVEFYRCQAVDTTTRTWSGYKAVSKGTYYVFEEIPTTGLTYTGSVPEIGSIYDSRGLVKVAELFNGVEVNTNEAGEAMYTVYMPEDAKLIDTAVTNIDGTVVDGTLIIN